jgi:hypothetical protein
MAVNWTTLTGAKTVPGSIANWVNRTDLPTENILLEAQAWIYKRLRVREMVSAAPITIVAGASSVALPADFLDPKQFLPYGWFRELPYYHEEMFMAMRDQSGSLYQGLPSRWTILNNSIQTDVTCTENFSGMFMYYALPAFLSAGTETNFLTIRYPTLLRHACLALAYEHMKDKGDQDRYLQLLVGGIEDANASNEMARRGQYMPS